MVADGAIARFVIHMGRGIDSVQLADAVDRIGTVPEDRAMIGAPRAMGVSSVDASWPGQGPAETPDIRDPAGGPSTNLSGGDASLVNDMQAPPQRLSPTDAGRASTPSSATAVPPSMADTCLIAIGECCSSGRNTAATLRSRLADTVWHEPQSRVPTRRPRGASPGSWRVPCLHRVSEARSASPGRSPSTSRRRTPGESDQEG